MKVFFMSHPVAGDVEGNLARAKRWLVWLYASSSGMVVIAPWIHDVELLPLRDSDPAEREIGLNRCFAVIGRCSGVYLVGGHVSPGMAREAAWAAGRGLEVRDLTGLGAEPPKEETPAEPVLPNHGKQEI